MSKLKWYKTNKGWQVKDLIHPQVTIEKRWFGCELYFNRGSMVLSIPFTSISSAKKVAQLIHNG